MFKSEPKLVVLFLEVHLTDSVNFFLVQLLVWQCSALPSLLNFESLLTELFNIEIFAHVLRLGIKYKREPNQGSLPSVVYFYIR